MFVTLSKYMRLNINKFLFIALIGFFQVALANENAESRIIKQQIVASGFKPSAELYRNPDENWPLSV